MPALRPPALSVPFAARNSARQSESEFSLASTNRATALDVCYSVYGDATPADGFVDRFYDQNAATKTLS
ncbi:hypothetical protein CC2G_010119 [Coprinopsis cinerea AmutBmut pab1-1]|nr:hypothetical protein CC2G_010119 [Coprinopsis cinerea AmutBmut pab1-1]